MEITTARVVNSSQLELVTLSYEVILDNLKTSLDTFKGTLKDSTMQAAQKAKNDYDAYIKNNNIARNRL